MERLPDSICTIAVLDFSEFDDESDRSFFKSVYGWMESHNPHGSAVMLSDGRIFGRTIGLEGEFEEFALVSVAGNDIQYWFKKDSKDDAVPEFLHRNAQAFGEGTTHLMRRLSIAVIGCSGTGSPVIEQLGKLGVGKLVLVDPKKSKKRILTGF